MHSYSIDTNERTTVTAYIAIISVIISMFISNGLSLIESPFASYVEAPSAMALFGGIHVLFNTYMWKWKCFKFMVKTPDLSGCWEGGYSSSYLDENNRHSNGEVRFTIEQNWTKIRIISENGKSISYSEVAGIFVNDNMGIVLRYQYKNEPRFDNVETMQCHTGFNKLRYLPDKNRLEGDYFNDKYRKTYGTLWYSKKICENKV